MIKVVRPSLTTSRALIWAVSKVSVSIWEVASSKIRILGLAIRVLAKAISYRSPLEKAAPFSTTGSSIPFSSLANMSPAPTFSRAEIISSGP